MMRCRIGVLVSLAALVSVCCVSCATYENDLARGHHAFEENDHERALAIFRGLERDVGRLSIGDRAHYAYLRGMTDYRVGFKSEARHWLALAAAIEQQAPGSLSEDWVKRMNDSLKELNESVYTAGIGSLTNSGQASEGSNGGAADTPAAPADSDDKGDKKTKSDDN